MIKGFLFDLDETIWSSEKAIIKTVLKTIYDEKNITLGYDDIKKLLRNNYTFKVILNKHNIYSLYRYWKNYKENLEDVTLFFPETANLLKTLKDKGKKLGFVTSLKKEFVINLLKRFKLYTYADVIITPSECRVPKPNPRSINIAITSLHLNQNEVIYIGDNENDLKAAKAAGCLFGLANWGIYHTLDEKSDYIFNELSDILKLV